MSDDVQMMTTLIGVAFVTPDHPAGGPGARAASTHPVLICAECGVAADKDHPAVIIWQDVQADFDPSPHLVVVHKGHCNRAWQEAHGDYLLSLDAGEVLTQLAHHYTNPLVGSVTGSGAARWRIHDLEDHLGQDVTPPAKSSLQGRKS